MRVFFVSSPRITLSFLLNSGVEVSRLMFFFVKGTLVLFLAVLKKKGGPLPTPTVKSPPNSQKKHHSSHWINRQFGWDLSIPRVAFLEGLPGGFVDASWLGVATHGQPGSCRLGRPWAPSPMGLVSLKRSQRVKTLENGWLEYVCFLLGWPIFWCELLVSGRV